MSHCHYVSPTYPISRFFPQWSKKNIFRIAAECIIHCEKLTFLGVSIKKIMLTSVRHNVPFNGENVSWLVTHGQCNLWCDLSLGASGKGRVCERRWGFGKKNPQRWKHVRRSSFEKMSFKSLRDAKFPWKFLKARHWNLVPLDLL